MQFIIPFLAFLAPLVVLYLAWAYHKKQLKKGVEDKFAWGFMVLVFLIGWGICLWRLLEIFGYA